MILLVYLAFPALHISNAVRICKKGLSLLEHVPNHKHQCLSYNQYTELYIFKPAYLAKSVEYICNRLGRLARCELICQNFT